MDIFIPVTEAVCIPVMGPVTAIHTEEVSDMAAATVTVEAEDTDGGGEAVLDTAGEDKSV